MLQANIENFLSMFCPILQMEYVSKQSRGHSCRDGKKETVRYVHLLNINSGEFQNGFFD